MRIKQDDAKITPETFFAWVSGRDDRYELVDGEVVMMAGAGRRHDTIVTNLISNIRPQTRGDRCQTFTGDTYIATGPMNRRMPDMGIDCGNPADDSLTAEKPALIVEVLSPTTRSFDISVKLAEYKMLASLQYILFVDTENPSVQFFWRDAAGLWQDTVLTGLDARIELPSVNVALSLADIYDEISFRPKPKLVENENDL
jgi:Uma2 family endonuclease